MKLLKKNQYHKIEKKRQIKKIITVYQSKEWRQKMN